ncbi:MAG TPA: PQQ-binding-like beta-propeller repeat protein [Gemmataceae bacterium]|nr:PQQ-binding-like beta-propeller repeat protein [Gemmataceae bacterium]
MKKWMLSLLGCLLLAGPAPAADWPQWQGPDRNNVSKETGLLKTWPKGGPKLLWTFAEAGMGYSAPAVVGDRLYTMGATGGKDYLFALDVKTGQKVWAAPLGPMFEQDRGDGPRGTPTVDGDHVYVITGQGTLLCLKTADGTKVWSKDFRKDLSGAMQNRWGYSESPLVDGDKLVCTPGGRLGTVAAFDKKTGAPVWRCEGLKDNAAYSSLVVANFGGTRQYVLRTDASVAGVAAKDGKLLWRIARSGPVAAIPTPVVFTDHVYVTSGYGAGCALIHVTKDGDKFRADEVYANRNMTNHHGGVVLVDGHVYGYSDGKGWVCQDVLKGNLVWQERSKLDKGSVTCADGQLYCYSEVDGTLVLVPATTAGWKEDGRLKLPRASTLERPRSQRTKNVWTHPVVANGRLYLRDQDLIFCFDVKAQ